MTTFLTTSTHSDVLFFTDLGKAYQIKFYDLPEGKPHPGAFAALCERLEAAPAEVVYVGDDLTADALGAQEAGLGVGWFRRPDGVGFSTDPDVDVPVANDLVEVGRLLDSDVG